MVPAWGVAGLDVDACFRKACTVTNEWRYTAYGHDPTSGVRTCLAAKTIAGRPLKVHLRTLAEILRPQERAAQVYEDLLTWIDATDIAAQMGCAPPPFEKECGEPIFPVDENGDPVKWWLTDLQLKLGAEILQPLCIDEAVEPPGDEMEAAPAEDAEKEWTEDEEDDASSEVMLEGDADEIGERADDVVLLPTKDIPGDAPADDAEDLRPMWAGAAAA